MQFELICYIFLIVLFDPNKSNKTFQPDWLKPICWLGLSIYGTAERAITFYFQVNKFCLTITLSRLLLLFVLVLKMQNKICQFAKRCFVYNSYSSFFSVHESCFCNHFWILSFDVRFVFEHNSQVTLNFQ